MPSFSAISLEKLRTCDPRLQRVFNEVIRHVDITILEGARSESDERQNILKGTSKLTDPRNSKHVIYDGRVMSLAVDVAPYPIDWKDLARFHYFGGFVMGIAAMMDIKLRWGGDWDGDTQVADEHFRDLVHYEVIA